MARIAYNHRLFVVGMTRSGKSELVRYLVSEVRVPVIVIDPKQEWELGVPAHLLTARGDDAAEAECDRIDWSQPVVHVCPAWREQHQLEALYAAINRLQGPRLVWSDEAYGVSTASWAPAGLLAIQTTGGGRGIGHFVTSQRPRNVARELFTEADHLFLFPPLDDDDLKAVCRGMPFVRFEEARRLLVAQPRYGFLWVDRRQAEVTVCPPLPEAYRTTPGPRKRRGLHAA